MKPNLSLKPAFSRRRWIPYGVLVVTLLLTAVATYYVAMTTEARDQLRFKNAVHRTQDNIQNRLETYIALLRAGNGFFAASDQVSLDEFGTFVDRLELKRRYPGIQGVGFSVRLRPEEKDVLVADMQRQGVGNFTIKPEFKRSEYHAVAYLEPLDKRNQAAIGFDMFTEPVRRAAMERARDTGAPAASGRVTLVQEIDKHKQAGFLIYIPVYRNGVTPNTVAERQAALRGFIYSPFRADDLMEGIFGTEQYPAVDFEIYDGTQLSQEHLLHRSNRNRTLSNVPHQSRFSATRTITVAGRPWTIAFAARPGFFELSSGRTLVPYIWFGGLLISLVLFSVTRSQVRAREAAERSAASLRQSEEALRESETRFRTLVEQSPLSTQILSPDGRTLQVNRAWEELWGVTLDRLGDYNILEDKQLVTKGIMPYIKQGFAGEVTTIPPVLYDRNQTLPNLSDYKDSPLWIQAYIYPVKDEAGNIREVVLMHEDISNHKRAEKEREQLLAREQAARVEAEAANRMKDEFLATLSHELRTPLNAMLGWTQMLRTRKFGEATAARALETIERNTKLLAQLIEDILDVSRIITGKVRLNIRPVNLESAIEAAIDTVRPAANANAIQIKSILDSSIEPILGDANRLQQVVWNLLSNAVKFTPKGGRVEVRLERVGRLQVKDSTELQVNKLQVESSHQPPNLQPTSSGNVARTTFKHLNPQPSNLQHSHPSIQIQVSDTGQGIAPDFLPYVFERFRQADSSMTRSHGGLGLGLAIVRHLVELHGGTIHAESSGIGQGATFIVNLPLTAVVEEANQPEPVQPSVTNEEPVSCPPSLDGLRILVVDDEPDAREMMITILEQYGAQVIAVATASEALEALTQNDFGLKEVGQLHEFVECQEQALNPNSKILNPKFHVLVSDIGMPQEDGYTLIRKVRSLSTEQGGRIPALALTAYARAEDRTEALLAGFQLHIPKPVDPDELAVAIANLTGRTITT